RDLQAVCPEHVETIPAAAKLLACTNDLLSGLVSATDAATPFDRVSPGIAPGRLAEDKTRLHHLSAAQWAGLWAAQWADLRAGRRPARRAGHRATRWAGRRPAQWAGRRAN